MKKIKLLIIVGMYCLLSSCARKIVHTYTESTKSKTTETNYEVKYRTIDTLITRDSIVKTIRIICDSAGKGRIEEVSRPSKGKQIATRALADGNYEIVCPSDSFRLEIVSRDSIIRIRENEIEKIKESKVIEANKGFFWKIKMIVLHLVGILFILYLSKIFNPFK
jgi:hypothetical protein